MRLRNRQEFLSLQKNSKRLVATRLCIDYRLTTSGGPKLGITAPSRYGSSPERSRFKRLVREAFRKSLADLPPHIELNVLPRQRAKGASAEEIRLELLKVLC